MTSYDLLSKSKTLKALSAPIKIYLFFQIWDWFADFDFRVVVAGILGTINFKDLIARFELGQIHDLSQLMLIMQEVLAKRSGQLNVLLAQDVSNLRELHA